MLSRREFLVGSFAAVALPRVLFRDGTADVLRQVLRRSHDENWRRLAFGELVGRCGMALLDTPYVGSTLEVSDDVEPCVVRLDGLDCVTFYESALGLARLIRRRGSSMDDLRREIEFMRYRGGRRDGYLSRLHYTSDWIDDNAAKGVVKNLAPDLTGAVRMEKAFDFMSAHPALYRQLKAHPDWVGGMAGRERAISARRPFYVPNEAVASIEPLLRTGDIIGIATSAAGLDCSHTGLVMVDEAGVRRFLNASSVKNRVVLGERLSEYAVSYKRNLGVMAARPL